MVTKVLTLTQFRINQKIIHNEQDFGCRTLKSLNWFAEKKNELHTPTLTSLKHSEDNTFNTKIKFIIPSVSLDLDQIKKTY